ncbi:MAG: hypothetical protein EOM55_01855 [Clostridia bacterium]|nr:hypothetical protein [Clostridia bacterium]
MFKFLTYLKLKNKNWERLSPNSRINIFQQIENFEAKRQGREPMKVIEKNFEDNMQGLCDKKSGKIYLSIGFFKKKYMQFWGLTVLFHEGRHAFQQEEVFENEKPNIFSKVYKWRKNLQGYVHYNDKEKFSYYAMQDVERDANKYALKRLIKLRFWLKNEKGFFETIKSKQDELDSQVHIAKKELGPLYKLKVKLRNKKERDK